jgi:hypothetical protein
MSCASLSVDAQAGDEPVFNVTTKNTDDQINIEYENGITTIDIHSPTGIGPASLVLESGKMPGTIILRLHLKGLEDFRLSSGQMTISASVPNSGMSEAMNQRLISSGRESSITPDHPLWMKIEIVSDQADKKIPVEDGYFEITIPKAFIQKAGNSFTVQWIDFYR